MLSDEQIAEIEKRSKSLSIYDMPDAVWRIVQKDIPDFIADRKELLAELNLMREVVSAYAGSARIIALYLDEYRDNALPYHEMIAEASRKVAAERDRLQAENDLMSKMLCSASCEYCIHFNPIKHDWKHKKKTCGGLCSVNFRFDFDRISKWES